MHTTVITLKNGEVHEGSINLFRPSFGWFTLFGDDRKFYFDECESVITRGQRVSINSPIEGEDQDEMLRAKKLLEAGRIWRWTEKDENGVECHYPQKEFEWESRYE